MIIASVILYKCETSSVTTKKNVELKVIENRVLRRIFGPRREEVAKGWREVNNESFRTYVNHLNLLWLLRQRRLTRNELNI
jgi:hypothetical protein